MQFKQVHGIDGNFSADSASVTLPYRATQSLPSSIDFFTLAGYVNDFFALEANRVLNVAGKFTLYVNSVQIHENFYARNYDINVTFGKEDRQTGSYTVTYDGSGGMVNVTAGTVISVHGDDAPDNIDDASNLIGVDGDNVRGIDIPVEALEITVQFRHPKAFLNRAYAKRVRALTGYPNNDEFLGYAPGEVRLRAPAFTESESESTASYVFEVSENRTDFEVSGITIDEKKGFDVLDPVYETAEGDDELIKKVKYFKCIRPAGREWKNYVEVFGWGGS